MELFKLVGSIFIDNKKADDSISKTDEKAEKLSKRFLDGIKTVGKWGVGIATAAGAAVTAVGAAVTKIADDTREYRNEIKKLETAFEDSNFKAETAKDTYQSLQSILGDTGQAVEASNFLAELCNTEKELADWTTICTGVYAKFGVSLPIEGLAEASNETAKTGTVTGGLADALNWASKEGETFGLSLKENIEFTELSSKEIKSLTESEKAEYEAKKAQYEAIEDFNKALSEASTAEDIFNLALAECSTEQERQALITETLHGLYSDIGEKYRENNEVVIKANEAQEKLNEALAKAGEKAEPVVTGIKLFAATILEQAIPMTENFIEKAELLGAWFENIGAYASEKLSPILSDLEPVFTNVKDSVQYFIDKLNEYIESGSASENITNIVKDAIDFLSESYEKAKEKVDDIVQGFKDAVEWGKEHETTVTLLAIAFGTLIAEITAYLIVSNAKKIADTAELALIWLMVAAENAHTAAKNAYTTATNLAKVATTAFSSALTFLASPVGITIAAIGALIAIIVALVKNWDTVKEVAQTVWNRILEICDEGVTWFEDTVNAVVEFFENLGKSIENIWKSISETAKNKWNDIKNTISEKIQAIKTKVNDAFESIKTSVTNKLDSMRKNAVQKVEDLKSGMVDKINSAKEKISGIVDKIKGFFDFTFKVPKIKLPHFSIKPKGWDIGDLLEGDIPKLGIEWYAKAMTKPMIMTKPTIFGYDAVTEKWQGGGDAGSEVVSGTNTLMNMISQATASNNEKVVFMIQQEFDRLFVLLGQYLPKIANMKVVMDTGEVVGVLTEPINERIGKIISQEERGI